MYKVLSFLLCLPCLVGASLRLTQDQRGLPIVVASQALPVERTSSDELRHYLKQVTGVSFEVVEDQGQVPASAIHLGATRLARQALSGLDRFGEEEWTVAVRGQNLFLAGGRPRGTLYAVYHFLEDVVGVRWLSPTVEHLPRKASLEVSEALSLRGCPALSYRSIYLVPGPSGNRFLMRNRMTPTQAAYGGRMIFGVMSGREASAGGHTMYPAVGTPDEIRALYKAHPEYFPLIDGVRTCDTGRANGAAQSQFCLTNPGLRKLWVEKMRAHIRNDRQVAKRRGVQPPMFYPVDQNDCFDGFCKCPACQAIVTRTGGNSGLLLDFANYVAEQLKDEAPEAVFQMMALHSTELPPKNITVHPRVGIRLCDTTSNMIHPWTHAENKKHFDNLKGWAALSDNIVMWDYSISYGSAISVNYPMPTACTFGPDLRTLKSHHGTGVFFEHEQVIGADMRDLKVWLEVKLCEDPTLSYEDLLKDFTDHFYGAAGGKVREYLRLLETAAAEAKARITWFPSLSSFSYISAPVLVKAYAIFKQAYELCQDDVHRQRLDEALMSLDRLAIARYVSFQKGLRQRGLTGASLPDMDTLKRRFQASSRRRFGSLEPPPRKGSYFWREYERNTNGFLETIAKRRELPMPAEFKDRDPESVHLFGTGVAQTYINYLKLVKDPESPAGEALRADMKDIEATPHKSYRGDKYVYPFRWSVWPTTKGTKHGTCDKLAGAMPKGYHWYRLGGGLKLTQTSVVAMFAGFFVTLDGVVNDNSELGQEYELWARVKVTGPDYFGSGRPTQDNVFYIDQFAAIRQTRHGAAE